ncbi:hypothetical protein HDC92_000576 [Pedobacter sp. AK017]|nr:hypothetical protein [Pedobacter sp. AK017]
MKTTKKKLSAGEAPLTMRPQGSSVSPEKKSVLGNLVTIVVRESVNILLTWVLKKLRPGVLRFARGASEKQG